MNLQLSLPDSVMESLRARWGDDLTRRTLEDLAAAWYRAGLITSGQVGEVLGCGWFLAQEFLRNRGLGEAPTLNDVVSDVNSIDEYHR